MSLIRLAYASEATFSAQSADSGVEPHVARILLASRRNNPRDGIVGGLYYGNDRFFQYLEGEEEAVRRVYARICADPRHRHVRILLEEPLARYTFSNWSMKYVPLARDVSSLLRRHGLQQFEPAQFDRELCEQMIELVRASSDDDKLVNYDTVAGPGARPEVMAPAIRNSLIVAVVIVVVALAAGGSLLI